MEETKRGGPGRHAVLILLAAIVAVPLLWMVTSSLKGPQELFTRPPDLLPQHPTLQSYVTLFEESHALTLVKNSLIVALGTTVASTALSALGAYSVTRFRFPGRQVIVLASLGAYVFPAVVLFVPLYIMFNNLGLTNSYLGLIAVHTAVDLPFSLWILRSFFLSIPLEIDEAAVIDGASFPRTFWSIILPLARPGLFTTALLAFVLSWSEFLFASVFMTDDAMKTIPVGMADFIAGFDVRWDQIMALAVVATLPVILLFLLVQKTFVRGLTAGAIKG
jgi:multiple sugar transport system permease protein